MNHEQWTDFLTAFVSAEGRATFWGAHINARDTRISLEVACNGVYIHAEQGPTLADAKARGAEVLRGVDSRGQNVTVWFQPFNAGFDVLRKGIIHSMGARDAVAYLNAFEFQPDAEVSE